MADLLILEFAAPDAVDISSRVDQRLGLDPS
jgi:hypothetical protein